jgi:flagellar export protein FliJ
LKRYEFRMAKVLRVRRMQEDAARAAVAQARLVEKAAAEKLAASQEHYAALVTVQPGASTLEFMALRDRGEFRASAVSIADMRRQFAADQALGAVDQWHAAHRRVDALERLDERRRDEYAIEEQRDQDATVDEIVTSRARRSA